jgi:hypothetical protein
VDVADAHAPRIYPGEALERLPDDSPTEFAVFGYRALFFMSRERELTAWSLDSRAQLGTRAKSEAIFLERPAMRCERDACFAVVVEGQGKARRMVVRRFDGVASGEREELGPGHVGEYTTIKLGPRTLAVWKSFDQDGLSARFVDARTGRALGSPFVLARSEGRIMTPELIASRDGPLLAWLADAGWRLGQLSPSADAITSVRSIPAAGFFLLAQATDDGVICSVFDAGTTYNGVVHSWRTTARAVFIPSDAQAPVANPITLMDAEGGGRGGFAAFAFAAPGYAAVLIAPQVQTRGPGALTLLREPCEPARPRPP